MPPVSGGRSSRRRPVPRPAPRRSRAARSPGRRRSAPRPAGCRARPPRRPARSAWPRCAPRRTSTATRRCRPTRRPARRTPAGTCPARRRACGRRRPASPRRRAAGGRPGTTRWPRASSANRASSGLTAPVVMTGSPRRVLTGSSSVKQVRVPVWQAGPTWSTLTSTVSPSQSSATDLTYWWCPDVSPFTQYSRRLRDQYVARPVVSVRCSASSSIQASMSTSPVSNWRTTAGTQAVGVAAQTCGDRGVEVARLRVRARRRILPYGRRDVPASPRR